jgi:hypothetical protein
MSPYVPTSVVEHLPNRLLLNQSMQPLYIPHTLVERMQTITQPELSFLNFLSCLCHTLIVFEILPVGSAFSLVVAAKQTFNSALFLTPRTVSKPERNYIIRRFE